MESIHIIHPFEPVYDKNSKILILGSFPSVKSREISFYYGHPQNRFWQVLAAVFVAEIPTTTEDKKSFLLSHNIAVWDVIQSCYIVGSSDSSIKNAVPNDLSVILNSCDIKSIFVNGKTAEKLYNKYIRPVINREAIGLLSTSPANAAYDVKRLAEKWEIIKI